MTTDEPASRLRVAVTGASGFIGSVLISELAAEGHEPIRLVRRPPAGPGEISWDPEAGRIDVEALEGIDAVVHLAAESIDSRWTRGQKRRLRESRTRGTGVLATALASLSAPPEVLVSVSAIGIYGADRGDERLTEESEPGSDFLAHMGRGWEAAADPAREAGIRVVHPRFGVVLGKEGGALRRMLPAFRMGVGGRLGSGKQWMSWVGVTDAARAILFAIHQERLVGPVNVVAPEPLSNAVFTEELGKAIGRPTLMVVPSLALRALFGEMADGTILASQRVYPVKLLAAGFRFRHATLPEALRATFGSTA